MVAGSGLASGVLEIISFAEALRQTDQQRRHLLLGNGFSIAAHRQFSYSSLFGRAFGETDGRLRSVFTALETTDFELVARRLNEALAVVRCYEPGPPVVEAINEDLAELRRRFVEALTKVHPPQRQAITDDQFAAANRFLAHFRRGGTAPLAGEIYTTNYDLLLYWATLAAAHVNTNDGFGGPRVTWSAEGGRQSVFHLHGALHLYEDEELVTTKVTYSSSPLMAQIARRLAKGSLPLFVSEGTSAQKRLRIEASPYLHHALGRFSAACDEDDASLFVFGHALAEQDEHITELIRDGRVGRVYVSAMDPQASRRRFAGLEAGWATAREELGRPSVELRLFPAGEAGLWG